MFSKIISGFDRLSALVIGDVMLDKYIFGTVERLSPEAPIPVVSVKKEKFVPGGAANVASNIASLGAKATLIGVVGKDAAAKTLSDELGARGIAFEPVINSKIPTIQKVRVLGSSQHLVRIDYEDKNFSEEDALCAKIKQLLPKSGLVIISDYAKGAITKKVVDFTKDACKKHNKLLFVDGKPVHKEFFNGVFLLKPNRREAEELSGMRLNTEQNVIAAGKKIIHELGCNLLITRGEQGMSLFEKGGRVVHIPTQAREVYDISGAGDTVISTLALAVGAGANLSEAAEIANHAAGIVVAKIGTATTTAHELLSAFEKENTKLKTVPQLKKIVEDLKAKGKRVVFTNGCFDILHPGHVELLRTARSYGDALIVGLNTDSSIKRIKGPKRPILAQDERVEIMSALESVSYVVLFDESEPSRIISELKPSIHVKGGDYNPRDFKKMPEAKVVYDYGGDVRIVKLREGKSTSGIIERIKNDGKNGRP